MLYRRAVDLGSDDDAQFLYTNFDKKYRWELQNFLCSVQSENDSDCVAY